MWAEKFYDPSKGEVPPKAMANPVSQGGLIRAAFRPIKEILDSRAYAPDESRLFVITDMYRVRTQNDLEELLKQSDRGDSTALFAFVKKKGKEPKIDDVVLDLLKSKGISLDNVEYAVRIYPGYWYPDFYDKLGIDEPCYK